LATDRFRQQSPKSGTESPFGASRLARKRANSPQRAGCIKFAIRSAMSTNRDAATSRFGGVLLTVALLCSACGHPDAKHKGEAIAEKYFALAASGKVDQILSLYDDSFYKVSSRSEWSASYNNVRTKLGRPIAHRLQSWQVNDLVGTSGSGQSVTLIYDVDYERAAGKEMLLVFFPSGSDTGGIRGHHFESAALLK
jgi:hypothetical protein